MKSTTTPMRQDLINDKVLAFEMWMKRWRDMTELGINDKAKEALVMIRKISFECEKLND